MLSREEQTYYSKQILLEDFGISGQERLKKAKVLVIGSGGLGCPVLQYISAAGIGTIGIVDGDIIERSNLHRQVLFNTDDIGKHKAQVAKSKIEALNPNITVKSHQVFLTIDNVLDIFKEYEVIVDCTDNYETRYLINDACYLLDMPLIYGAIYQFQGQVSIFNYQNGPTYRCLFPVPPSPESSTNCEMTGVIGVLPGIIGLFQANEVIKLVAEKGDLLSGEVMIYNAMKNSFQKMKLDRRDSDFLESFLNKGKLDKDLYGNAFCTTEAVTDITLSDLTENSFNQYQWVDVREEDELPVIDFTNIIKAPLSAFSEHIDKIDADRDTIVFCKSGMRSKKAIQMLNSRGGFTKLFNLKNGLQPEIIEQWKQKVK